MGETTSAKYSVIQKVVERLHIRDREIKEEKVRGMRRIGTKSFRVSFSVLLYITYGKETGSVF